MTDKITLGDVSSFVNDTSATTIVNSNSTIIETAFNNTLSRDGTSPNQMEDLLDMNSNRIINLPAPVTADEPARLQDLATLTGGGTIVVNAVPTGGTIGQVLAKNSSSNFDIGWTTEVPLGGTARQALSKNSGSNFDASWITQVPDGGTTGQALVKNSNANLDTTWMTPLAYPSGATDNAIARFDSSSSNLQNSTLIVSDTGVLSGGSSGVPIVGRTTNTVPAAGQVGEYIANVIAAGGGPTIITGSAGQIWNSISLTAGMWLVGAQTGVFQTTGTPVFTHMHGGFGVGITTIPTAPGNGCVTALHITSNNPNGWLFPNGPIPMYLSSTSTVNAVATSDLSGGTGTFYGTLWAMRIA